MIWISFLSSFRISNYQFTSRGMFMICGTLNDPAQVFLIFVSLIYWWYMYVDRLHYCTILNPLCSVILCNCMLIEIVIIYCPITNLRSGACWLGRLSVWPWILGSRVWFPASVLRVLSFGKIIHLHFLILPRCKWVPVLLGKFPATDWRPFLGMIRFICLPEVTKIRDWLQNYWPHGLKKTKKLIWETVMFMLMLE